MTKIHNVIVKYAQKLIRMLERDKNYKKFLDEYKQCNDSRKKELLKQMNKIRESYKISEK